MPRGSSTGNTTPLYALSRSTPSPTATPCSFARRTRPYRSARLKSRDPRTNLVKCSYLDYGALERALSAARAEAVWAGWGFVAEHAEFADLCRELGIVFIGPDGDVMRKLGG